MEHLATRFDGWQKLATVAKSSALDMAGVLKLRQVTKANGDRDHSDNIASLRENNPED